MKHYRKMYAHPFRNATPRWNMTDRCKALTILSLPFSLAILALLLAVVTTAMGEMVRGTFRFYLAALSYSYLMACLVCLPAYTVSYAWYWWKTKDKNTDFYKPLLWMPLIMAAFSWFPAVLFPGLTGTGRIQVFLILAVASLILGYFGIGIVKIVLSARKIHRWQTFQRSRS